MRIIEDIQLPEKRVNYREILFELLGSESNYKSIILTIEGFINLMEFFDPKIDYKIDLLFDDKLSLIFYLNGENEHLKSLSATIKDMNSIYNRKEMYSYTRSSYSRLSIKEEIKDYFYLLRKRLFKQSSSQIEIVKSDNYLLKFIIKFDLTPH